MQIKITFISDGRTELPIAYRHAVQSMIYNALRSSPGYSHFLHDKGISDGKNTTFKYFTFGQLEGNYTVANKRIIFDKEISLEIRCIDPFMFQLLLDGFRDTSNQQLMNNSITVLNCKPENKIIFDDRITVKMLSPITVLSKTPDNHTLFYSPDEDRFYEKIVENARRKWINKFANDSDFLLSISPDNCRYNKLVTKFKETYINAWYGQFILQGNPKTLNFLYDVGIGNKNSQGFGMFEVL